MSNVPDLRFKEFNKEWDKDILQNIFEIFQGYAFSSNDSLICGVPWIKITDVGIQKMNNQSPSFLPNEYLEKFTKYIIKEGDYVLALTRPILNGKLKVAKVDKTYNNSLLNQRVGKLITTNNIDFIYFLLQKTNIINSIDRFISGTEPPNLSVNQIKNIKIFIPKKDEQEKIASFLSSVDGRIEQLTKYEEQLQLYKKGVMQQLFKQEVRFKKDDESSFENWKNKKLSKLMYEHKERNYNKTYTKNDVLSVSGKHGIVNQIELQGRSFAGVSVDNYHIVKINDIVYTKSPLKANPFGIIKVNTYQAGIVSTLYAVYRPTDELFPPYIDYYFQLDDNVNRYLRPLVHKGAKNDMKINNSHVLSGRINIPSYDEQVKIVDFLSSIDSKIEKVQNQLKQTKGFKKGLLQRMFV